MKNSKKWIYIIMIVAGIGFTVFLFFTVEAKEVCKVVWNIFAMLGSGVFCSALVALLIEIRNEKQLEREQLVKRKNILLRFESSLNFLLVQELKNLTSCVELIEKNNKKMIKKTMCRRDVIERVKYTIGEIKDPNGKVYQIHRAVGVEYCQAQECISKKISKNTLALYGSLSNTISCVLEDLNMYLLTDVLKIQEINELEGIKSSIDDIVAYAQCEEEGQFLEEKYIFFENFSTQLQVLGINLEGKIDCCFYE